jgi:3-deoxy-D-manno-octulosonate 8-phosphate phosphatase (KDO 8-P phosphatase)
MVSEDLRQRLARIRLVLLDVDGILTDGRLLWLGDEVGWGRFFHVSDGYGIKLLLRNQLPVGLISGSDNNSTRERIKLLGIPMAFLGSEDKREAWTQALAQTGVREEETLYMGDELFDIPLLKRAGFAATVSSATSAVQAVVHYVCERPAGHGAVREVLDLLCAVQNLRTDAPDF